MMTTQGSAVLSEDDYTVTEVAGHAPAGLDDVVGATTVTVTRDGQNYRLIGTGAMTGGAVHFHQKEIGSAGDEVLVWTILERGDGRLVAEPPVAGR
jgi:hypothetical protein